MIPPAGLAIASLTIMLWILWSDSLRARSKMPVLYALRIALFLIVAAILVLNRFRYPHLFSTAATVLVGVVVLVALFGSYWFARRLVARGL
jgi:hypothetical protein